MCKKISNILKDKKKLGIVISAFLLVIIVILNIYNRSNRTDNIPLVIEYSDGTFVKYDDFSKKFTDTRTITIKNNTGNVKVYSLRWRNMINTIKEQNLFLYEIKCEGYECKSITPSQIPPVDVPIFSDIYLEAMQSQKYTIKFIYKGSEKGAKFSGDLVIEEGVRDKEYYKRYMEGREAAVDRHKKIVDKVLNLR